MSKQDDTDPLPYTQVDRAVAPKVIALAGLIGTTTQHAKGSLIDWWELHSEPRRLEELVRAGKTEVILTSDEVIRSFRIASGGKVVEPDDLVTLGLLEKRGPDELRVRGMSRAFGPILKRAQLRKTASEGGKKSAESRTARFGTAQPNGSGVRSGGRTEGERKANAIDQRSTINDQRTEIRDQQDDLPIDIPKPTTPERETSIQEDYHRYFLETRERRFARLGVPFVADETPNPAFVNAVFKRIAGECQNDHDVVWDLILEYFAEDWPAKYEPPYPFSAFASQKVWPKLLAQLRGDGAA